jgi:hypothetical protein
MFADDLLGAFDRHADDLYKLSNRRKRAAELRCVVDDNEADKGAMDIEATLGVRQPTDKFSGCVNLRTLQTLLKKIDDSGWERCAFPPAMQRAALKGVSAHRSPHQLQFHEAFIKCVARVLYRNEWATSRPEIMAHNGWDKCSSEVLISTPRRLRTSHAISYCQYMCSLLCVFSACSVYPSHFRRADVSGANSCHPHANCKLSPAAVCVLACIVYFFVFLEKHFRSRSSLPC